MLEVICLIIGIVLVFAGVAIPNVIVAIVGLVFLALGGVIIIFVSDDGGWDW